MDNGHETINNCHTDYVYCWMFKHLSIETTSGIACPKNAANEPGRDWTNHKQGKFHRYISVSPFIAVPLGSTVNHHKSPINAGVQVSLIIDPGGDE